MNRRRLLAGVGAGITALAGGYAGVRIDDLRPYDPDLPTGETPRERIIAAAAHRHAADHRVRTAVRVRRDGTGDAPYTAARYEQRHQHSRRRHLHSYVGLNATPEESPCPGSGLPTLVHWQRVAGADTDGTDDSLPVGGLLFYSDGLVAFDYRDATPATDPERFGDARARAIRDEIRMYGEFVRPHRAAWTERERTDATVTYELSGADAYSQVVPLLYTPKPVNEGSRVRATLDRETGRLRRLRDRRDVTVPPRRTGEGTVGGFRLVYDIETRFDRYGDVSVSMPPGADVPLDARLAGTVGDFGTY